jgi:hypothetical protein
MDNNNNSHKTNYKVKIMREKIEINKIGLNHVKNINSK